MAHRLQNTVQHSLHSTGSLASVAMLKHVAQVIFSTSPRVWARLRLVPARPLWNVVNVKVLGDLTSFSAGRTTN